MSGTSTIRAGFGSATTAVEPLTMTDGFSRYPDQRLSHAQHAARRSPSRCSNGLSGLRLAGRSARQRRALRLDRRSGLTALSAWRIKLAPSRADRSGPGAAEWPARTVPSTLLEAMAPPEPDLAAQQRCSAVSPATIRRGPHERSANALASVYRPRRADAERSPSRTIRRGGGVPSPLERRNQMEGDLIAVSTAFVGEVVARRDRRRSMARPILDSLGLIDTSRRSCAAPLFRPSRRSGGKAETKTKP